MFVNVTWNENDVDGVPDPGEAPPTVSVERGDWFPQLAAATGEAVRNSAPTLTASAKATASPPATA